MEQDPGPEILDRVTVLLNEVEARLDEGCPDEALQIALQSERLLSRHPQVEAVDLRVDTHYLLASCYFELRDVPAALKEYELVRQIDSKDPEIGYWQARALFHCWRFEEAGRLLASFRTSVNTRAATYYYQALLLDFSGHADNAEQLFGKAESENPDEFPRPYRVPADSLQSMLLDAIESLPLDLKRALEDVKVEISPLPDPGRYASPELDPLVLGLCRRRGIAGPGPKLVPEPENRIELFQRNLERVCSDSDELRDELRQTLLHEIGHHLDWDREIGHGRGLN